MNLAPQSVFAPSRDVHVGIRPSWVNIIKRALVIIVVDLVGDGVAPARRLAAHLFALPAAEYGDAIAMTTAFRAS